MTLAAIALTAVLALAAVVWVGWKLIGTYYPED